jgi:glycosyltransferase involved in cell wall biosynthesis
MWAALSQQELQLTMADTSSSQEGWLGGTRALDQPVTVLIPVYREVQSLPLVVAQIEALAESGDLPKGSELLVVDDGSDDSTLGEWFFGSSLEGAPLARRAVVHPRNMGYGAAVKTGLRAARFDTLVLIDGDGTYPVEAIPDLLRLLDRADMVVAARIGEKVAIPSARKPAKWVLAKVAEYLINRSIPDLNSGLRVFRVSEAKKFMGFFPSGFSFTTTITLAYESTDRIVVYRPINYFVRAGGKSKIRPLRDTQRILLTIIRSVMAFSPLRVFVPMAGMLVALGLLVLGFYRDHRGNVADGTVAVCLLSAMLCLLAGFLADGMARSRRS